MLRLFLLGVLAAAPVAAATTLQQDFDAAQAMLDASKFAEARDAFATLNTRFPPTSQGKAASLVRARLGAALLASGDAEAAEPVLTAALAGLKGSSAQDVDERASTMFDLARAQENRGALDSAAESYRGALAAGTLTAGSNPEIVARIGLARTLIWSQPDEARRLLDALLALPPATFGTAPDQVALLQTLRGRVELNAGQHAEARRWFTLAARSAGGSETRRISVADVRIRGDLAIANFKLGRMDEVQKYVALSGAGSLQSEGLTMASHMPLPPCAPLTGLAPDAVAVVEFAIGTDGRVSGATPIYADRGSGVIVAAVRDDGPEVLFPQAVRRWVWKTDDAARLQPFWRQAVRVELRCFTARPDRDPIDDAFDRDYTAWAATKGVRPMPDLPDNDGAALPAIRAELAAREASAGKDSLQLVEPLRWLAANAAAPDPDRHAASLRRLDLLSAAAAPASVVGRARVADIANAAYRAGGSRAGAAVLRDRLTPLLAETEAAGDGETRIAMYIRLRLAEAHDDLKGSQPSHALLDRIIAAPETVVAAGDPLRTATLLRLANQAAAARDAATATSALAATGLSPEQCALVDVRPQPVSAGVGDKSFPDEARRWSTGGYVRAGYDISAEGKTLNIRTIVASPPFIFGPATEKAVARFSYRPVFRPGNTIGCTGTTQSVRYRMLP